MADSAAAPAGSARQWAAVTAQAAEGRRSRSRASSTPGSGPSARPNSAAPASSGAPPVGKAAASGSVGRGISRARPVAKASAASPSAARAAATSVRAKQPTQRRSVQPCRRERHDADGLLRRQQREPDARQGAGLDDIAHGIGRRRREPLAQPATQPRAGRRPVERRPGRPFRHRGRVEFGCRVGEQAEQRAGPGLGQPRSAHDVTEIMACPRGRRRHHSRAASAALPATDTPSAPPSP